MCPYPEQHEASSQTDIFISTFQYFPDMTFYCFLFLSASMLRPAANAVETTIPIATDKSRSRYRVPFARQITVLLKRAMLCTLRDLVSRNTTILVSW